MQVHISQLVLQPLLSYLASALPLQQHARRPERHSPPNFHPLSSNCLPCGLHSCIHVTPVAKNQGKIRQACLICPSGPSASLNTSSLDLKLEVFNEAGC